MLIFCLSFFTSLEDDDCEVTGVAAELLEAGFSKPNSFLKRSFFGGGTGSEASGGRLGKWCPLLFALVKSWGDDIPELDIRGASEGLLNCGPPLPATSILANIEERRELIEVPSLR
ncbi:hypothetical protein OGAPHI_004486 [Ogataea philodendri]|uniref:Uncharacterized protein n=1 Tax=Ogataea philodendri TaxID=1378263 RepID=A0A9P8P7L0_9ASCO|nr:uncharacterized protein OGAPHI_004486 [Ogataea philodendri]KAH3666297.1 hypothetical protein OGAPHI_004486 [Ogataea philodendri]